MIKRVMDLPAMQAFAARMAQHAAPGDVFALSGDLGAGKTSFAQAFITPLLASAEPVASPTYTLVQRYDTKQEWQIFHADLYRLKHPSELEEIGLAEAFDHHVALIEWPEIILNELPKGCVHIMLHQAGEGRQVRAQSIMPRWQDFLMREA